MTTTPLHFELPKNLSIKKFLAKLSKEVDLQIVSQQYSIKTFYDSFDWRLYQAGMICEFNHNKKETYLRLIDRRSGKVIALEEMSQVPTFVGQYKEGRIKKQIESILEMRALLSLCQLPYELFNVNILNKNQKTVVRLQIEEYEFLTNRVSIFPLKGYDKAVDKIRHIFLKPLELTPSRNNVLKTALKQQGKKPKDYSSKLGIKLKPDMRADKASKIIYRYLLQAMQVNEAGTIADTDSEFLHDYRVAVRRTRAGLSQIKGSLPNSIVPHYSEFFARLGEITGATRDLDVYLLSYKQYKAALPVSIQDDLDPLYDFLKTKQVAAQKKLAKELASSAYKKQLADWENYLYESFTKKEKARNSDLLIKALADRCIWRIYRRIIKEGSAINEVSPAEALHDLRKTCKKLRYLMEFFQSLYPETEIKGLIKILKNFQTVLGDFQDYEVQETNIKHFSEEMMAKNAAANTLLAMGVLVQHLDNKRCEARNDFAEQFVDFKQSKNQQAFKNLFSHKTKETK